jgi:hypothetical protein
MRGRRSNSVPLRALVATGAATFGLCVAAGCGLDWTVPPEATDGLGDGAATTASAVAGTGGTVEPGASAGGEGVAAVGAGGAGGVGGASTTGGASSSVASSTSASSGGSCVFPTENGPDCDEVLVGEACWVCATGYNGPCEDPYYACVDDDACDSYWLCLNGCFDAACDASCEATYGSAAADLYDVMEACVLCDACPVSYGEATYQEWCCP